MIAGTNTECKILNVEVQDSIAIVTLLFFASKPTSPSQAFQIYLQDREDSLQDMKLLSQETYWVDNVSNFSNDLTNININKYKEIKLEIDITNNNSSNISNNRWFRECYIHIVNTRSTSRIPSWSSELLSLVSKDFSTPNIKSFYFYSNKSNIDEDCYTIHLTSELSYKEDEDYNFNNKNFYYIVNIKSATTEYLIERIEQDTESMPQIIDVETNEVYKINQPVIIELVIKNKLGQTVLKYSKTFVPNKKISNTYIKTNSGIKKVLGFFIKRGIEEDESKSEWLETTDVSFNDASDKVLIQSNYNNAAVKTPSESKTPNLTVYYNQITNIITANISANIDRGYYLINLVLNNNLLQIIELRPETSTTFEWQPYQNGELVISGCYVDSFYQKQFNTFTKRITYISYASEATVTSDQTICTDRE